MAELDTSGGGKHKGGKVRTKKKSTRVDLTAMVDLAFLLVTFFMLTTTLSKPKSMSLVMPDKDDKKKDEMAVPETRTLTILLGKDHKIEWYRGLPGKFIGSPTTDNFGKSGIRKSIEEVKQKIFDESGGKPMIVLVKPSDHSVYGDMVNIMDELNIAKVDIRAIVEILPGEVELLKRDNNY